MRNLSQVLLDEESPFSSEELFISRTDKRGIIAAGNPVFSRVAKYPESEMIGRPHNMIRHPDMPRAIFKLFWDTISKNEIIAAYVKNRARDGSYYWVLATVFPIEGGYLSIRLKPTSTLLTEAENLYKKLIPIDRDKGIGPALNEALDQLKTLGFSDYRKFMLAALKTELSERDRILQEMPPKTFRPRSQASKVFTDMKEMLEPSRLSFRHTLKKLATISQFRETTLKYAGQVSQSIELLGVLSVNMSISAHKLGKEGGTLAIVATTFQNTAKQILSAFEAYQASSQEVVNALEEIELSLLCSRTIIEMISFNLGENIELFDSHDPRYRDSRSSAWKELSLILNLADQIFSNNSQKQIEFFNKLIHLHKTTAVLQKLITQLELISTGGKLEASRSPHTQNVFKPFLNEMETLVSQVAGPVGYLLETLKDLNNQYENLSISLKHVELALLETKQRMISAESQFESQYGMQERSQTGT